MNNHPLTPQLILLHCEEIAVSLASYARDDRGIGKKHSIRKASQGSCLAKPVEVIKTAHTNE